MYCILSSCLFVLYKYCILLSCFFVAICVLYSLVLLFHHAVYLSPMYCILSFFLLVAINVLYCEAPAISLHSHTVSLVQWVNPLLPVMRDPGSIPKGVLMWNRDSPVSFISLHWWPQHDWSVWPRLRGASSRTVTRPSCQQCDNPTWFHTALLSRFHARCRSSFRLHNRHSWLVGGALWRGAISLHSHTVSLVQWVNLLLPVLRDPGSIPRGVLMWNWDSPVSVVLLQYSHSVKYVGFVFFHPVLYFILFLLLSLSPLLFPLIFPNPLILFPPLENFVPIRSLIIQQWHPLTVYIYLFFCCIFSFYLHNFPSCTPFN